MLNRCFSSLFFGGKRLWKELTERTANYSLFWTETNPHDCWIFGWTKRTVWSTISSRSRYDHFDTSPCIYPVKEIKNIFRKFYCFWIHWEKLLEYANFESRLNRKYSVAAKNHVHFIVLWNWKNVKVFSGELTWLGSQGKIKAIIQEWWTSLLLFGGQCHLKRKGSYNVTQK